jgi:hypothetical protein
MTPRQFRDLPKHEQIEMIAHRREVNLRKAHAEKVRQAVSKEQADAERKR